MFEKEKSKELNYTYGKNVVSLTIMIRYHDSRKHNSIQSNERFTTKEL